MCVFQSYHFLYYANFEVSLESQAAGHQIIKKEQSFGTSWLSARFFPLNLFIIWVTDFKDHIAQWMCKGKSSFKLFFKEIEKKFFIGMQ